MELREYVSMMRILVFPRSTHRGSFVARLPRRKSISAVRFHSHLRALQAAIPQEERGQVLLPHLLIHVVYTTIQHNRADGIKTTSDSYELVKLSPQCTSAPRQSWGMYHNALYVGITPHIDNCRTKGYRLPNQSRQCPLP